MANKKELLRRWWKAEETIEKMKWTSKQKKMSIETYPGYYAAKSERDNLEREIGKMK